MTHPIQNKLYKAYGKVAKKLGEYYEVYRPDGMYLNSSTFIDEKFVSVSSDNQYNTHPAPHKATMYKLWIDGRLNHNFELETGDYLYNIETGRTFFVSYQELNLPLEAIECNGFVTVSKVPSYQSGADVEFRPDITPNLVDTMREFPAYIGTIGSTGVNNGFIPGRTTYSSSDNRYEVYLYNKAGLIELGSIITHGSVKISVQQVFYGTAGYHILGNEVK